MNTISTLLDSWQKQYSFLDVRGQMEQVHDLRDACAADLPNPGQFGVVANRPAAEQFLETQGQCHRACDALVLTTRDCHPGEWSCSLSVLFARAECPTMPSVGERSKRPATVETHEPPDRRHGSFLGLVAAMNKDLLTKMANDPAIYRQHLLIDRHGQAVPLGDVLDSWQKQDFEAIDGGWLRAMGRPAESGYSRAWLERCRGGSKTADLAVMVAYALAFAARPIRGIAAAADADQAALLRQAIERLLRLNGWLQEALTCRQWKVENFRTGSDLTIISSDAPTSYGFLIDFAICDELCHWQEGRGEELFGSVFSAMAKRRDALLVCAGNAGWMETWQARVRETVRDDPDWYFHAVCEPASWISPKHIEEQRRLLPPLAFDRLWANVWTSGSGDAIAPADIDRAVCESGPMSGSEEYDFWGGLDLSVTRDTSAFVVVGREHTTNHLRLALCRAWTPPRGGKIDLVGIQDAVAEARQRYNLRNVIYDVFQAELMRQQLERIGVRMQEISFSGKPAQEMASELIEVFSSGRITLYRDPALLSDLRRLRIREAPSGWRLAADRTSAGHADRAIALAMACWAARQEPYNVGPWIITEPDRRDLSLMHPDNIPEGVFLPEYRPW